MGFRVLNRVRLLVEWTDKVSYGLGADCKVTWVAVFKHLLVAREFRVIFAVFI